MELTKRGAVFSFPFGETDSKAILANDRNRDANLTPLQLSPPEDLQTMSLFEQGQWFQQSLNSFRQAVQDRVDYLGDYQSLMLRGVLSQQVPPGALYHEDAQYWMEVGPAGQILAKFQSPVYGGEEIAEDEPAPAKPTPPATGTRTLQVPVAGVCVAKMDLTQEKLPKPRSFTPALLKVLGQMTNNTPRVYVRSEEAIRRVLQELGISAENCPWPMKGKPSVHRNISYAYRNAKEGYKKRGALFVATSDSGKWALNELGAQEALQYNPGGSVPSGVVADPLPKVTGPIPPDQNRTLFWLEEQGPKFIADLKAFASARFPRSAQLAKIEDHVQTYLTELIAEDKIGKSFDRHGKWPSRTNVLSWWQRNSITSQLRAEGKEPVCMANHGAMTDARRKAQESGSTKWAKTPVGAPQVVPVAGETLSLDFVGGNLEEEMAVQHDARAFLAVVSDALDDLPDGPLYKEVMLGLSDGGTPQELIHELGIPETLMADAMLNIRDQAEKFREAQERI